MRAYFKKAIALRRKEPRNDLLTALVQAEEERQALSADEVLAMAMLILIAGNETTRNLLGNTALTLLEQPAILAKVQRDRSLVPQLIEEVLRYDSPVQIVFRRTTAPIAISGTAILHFGHKTIAILRRQSLRPWECLFSGAVLCALAEPNNAFFLPR